MKVSLVIARIAGTESTAKMTSTIAMAASAAAPVESAQRPCSGRRRFCSRSTIASSAPWSWRWRSIFQPVQTRKAANTKLSHPNAASAAAPTTMKTRRSASAATMP